MEAEPDEFGISDLFYWLLGGAIASIVIFTLFAIAYEMSGDVVISSLSAFAAGFSSIISALLVGIYIKQTNILERHGQIMYRQTELMKLQYIPEVFPINEPKFESDNVEISLENSGSGPATELKLVTRLEFRNSQEYDSPVTGVSDFERIEDGDSGEKYLAPGSSKTYKANSKLEVATLSSEKRPRSFRNIIKNLQNDVDSVRISLFVRVEGKRGEPQQTELLSEEAFYASLDSIQNNTLEECYRISTPA